MATTESVAHPYYPTTATIPHYQPNETPLPQLLLTFGGLTFNVIFVVYYLANSYLPASRLIDRFSASWFALCGFLHCFFEGFYVLNHDQIAGQMSTFAQLWKEYTLSDSRYLTSDVFLVCIETITVFAWGPLSWLVVYSILNRSPYRHILQTILCTAHLYGAALYYATNWQEQRVFGTEYSRPEFMYYWVYYAGLNAPWIAVPLVLLYDSLVQTSKAFAALGREQAQRKQR